jgi:hypothetical protein
MHDIEETSTEKHEATNEVVDENKWMCRRCHHKSSTKGNLVKHLSRQTPCVDDYDKITIKDYIDELTRRAHTGNLYVCPYCPSKYTTRQARHKHKKTCRARPKEEATERVVQLASTIDIEVNADPEVIYSAETGLSNYEQAELDISRETRDKHFYKCVLERHFNASHRVLVCGITDITTSDCHIKIKKWSAWQEAIGQLQSYNNDLKRDKLMACFFGDISSNIKNIAAINMNKLGIQCLEFFNDIGRFCLRDVITNQVIKLDYLNE